MPNPKPVYVDCPNCGRPVRTGKAVSVEELTDESLPWYLTSCTHCRARVVWSGSQGYHMKDV